MGAGREVPPYIVAEIPWEVGRANPGWVGAPEVVIIDSHLAQLFDNRTIVRFMQKDNLVLEGFAHVFIKSPVTYQLLIARKAFTCHGRTIPYANSGIPSSRQCRWATHSIPSVSFRLISPLDTAARLFPLNCIKCNCNCHVYLRIISVSKARVT